MWKKVLEEIKLRKAQMWKKLSSWRLLPLQEEEYGPMLLWKERRCSRLCSGFIQLWRGMWKSIRLWVSSLWANVPSGLVPNLSKDSWKSKEMSVWSIRLDDALHKWAIVLFRSNSCLWNALPKAITLWPRMQFELPLGEVFRMQSHHRSKL